MVYYDVFVKLRPNIVLRQIDRDYILKPCCYNVYLILSLLIHIILPTLLFPL
jgi:hypothetical protein